MVKKGSGGWSTFWEVWDVVMIVSALVLGGVDFALLLMRATQTSGYVGG